MERKIEVGCYYFPNYHPGDKRNTVVHGPRWSEWNLVRNAVPRFPGHRQPKIPLWGYEDESDPAVMKKKIRTAAEYGIDYFIFDYYYYNDGPFLEDCLDKGFLPAVKGEIFKFALMWANHDWTDIHPCNHKSRPLLYPGLVTKENFVRITDEIIERYFKHPNYYAPDNKPYFSIYHLPGLIDSLGGIESAKKAIADFRDRVRKAGFADLELNVILRRVPVLPDEDRESEISVAIDLGFDSTASYVWVHHVPLPQNSFEIPYLEAMKGYFAEWDNVEKECTIPYYPNVTVGWDPAPRTIPSDDWAPGGPYPFTAVFSQNTPEAFEEALLKTKIRLEKENIRTFSINCWNEWTEGSMLEPESQYGMGYLEAVKKVFKH